MNPHALVVVEPYEITDEELREGDLVLVGAALPPHEQTRARDRPCVEQALAITAECEREVRQATRFGRVLDQLVDAGTGREVFFELRDDEVFPGGQSGFDRRVERREKDFDGGVEQVEGTVTRDLLPVRNDELIAESDDSPRGR